MAVVKRPFISESGFQSTGFTVDTAGNVTVRTITNTYTPPAPAGTTAGAGGVDVFVIVRTVTLPAVSPVKTVL